MTVASQVVDVAHKRPPLKALTSIRFFAAIYVVLFHLNVGFNVAGAALLGNFMRSGYTGVTLFFVLSGYVLAYNYQQVTDSKKFWIARFARIYPAYALSLLASLCRPAVWRAPHVLLGGALSFGLVQAYWIPLYSAVNPAAWTLSVEAFFYALFPFLLPRLRVLRQRTFWMMEALYLLFLCVPVVLMLTHHSDWALQLSRMIEGPFPLFRLNTFVVGVFVGSRFIDKPVQETRTARFPWQVVGGMVASTIFLCLSLPPYLLPLRTFLLTFSFVLLIVGLAQVEWLILTNHWMQVAGEISYGIYVLQFPVILTSAGLYRVLFHTQEAQPHWVGIPLVILAAYVSFRWLEIPARLEIRRVLSGEHVAVRVV